MGNRTRLHASLRRHDPPSRDATTGEIRVLIALYELDEHHGDIPLVMSRAEACALFAHLQVRLTPVPEQPSRAAGVMR